MSEARPPAGTSLCRLDEIADPGARGFTFPAPEAKGRAFQGFVVRKAGALHGYVDACPHTGGPLPAAPDRYLDAKGDWILCWTHGAMFQIADGLCVAGPCVKRSLRPWPVRLRGDEVVTA